jgi:hypothetical protein
MKSKMFPFVVLCVAFLPALVVQAQTQPIDNFTGGPHNVTLLSGTDTNFQPSDGSLVGPGRLTHFLIGEDPASNPLHQPATLDIGNGYLVVDTGARVAHRLEVFYGFDADGNPAPMNLNLAGFTKFRVHFDTLDQGLNFNMQVIAANNPAVATCGVNQPGDPTGIPFFVEFEFTCFLPNDGPPPDFSHIDMIDLIFQTGNVIGGHDYAITLVEAVPEPSVARR